MIVYEVPGKQHTAETLRLAAERARAADVHLVVASTAGDTALAALDAAEAAGILDKLVIVGSVPDKGVQKMRPEVQEALARKGVPLVLASRRGAAVACLNIARRLDGQRVPLMKIR